MLYQIVKIKKPLYENEKYDCVRVYDRYVKEAIKNKQFLLVKSKNGERIFNPKWIKANAKVVEQVFLRPDEPMRLFELYIPKRPATPDEELKQLCQTINL